MARIVLSVVDWSPPLLLSTSSAAQLALPKCRLMTWVQLPGLLMPRDAVVDTGSPFSCFPKQIWSRLSEGLDYEWFPFEPGTNPPLGRMAGWTYRFRIARFLGPVILTDGREEHIRNDIFAQFADTDPPDVSTGRRTLAVAVIGLCGGLLDNTTLELRHDPVTKRLLASLNS